MRPPMSRRGMWQQRAMSAMGRVTNVSFPHWLAQYSVATYLLTLVLVTLVYSTYMLPWYYMLSGVVSVLVFFFYGWSLAKRTSPLKLRKEKTFEQRIFWIAFIPRITWMICIYLIFMQNYGNAFGFEKMDASGYDMLGYSFKVAISEGHFMAEWNSEKGYLDISDMGYATYLGFIYLLTGTGGVTSFEGIGADNLGIVVARLLKCVWSSLTVLLIYRLAKRNFGEQPARVAAIFCALWPNFWYYCGVHLKEVEMVFLVVLYIERAEHMLRSRRFTAWEVGPVVLIAAILFTFRTPLAMVAILSLLFAIVMSSSRVVTWGKRIIVGGLVVALVGVTIGTRIEEKSYELMESVQSGQQKGNMEWRAVRKDGNAFSKYAGAAVFAPMIFSIPFPTMVDATGEQQVQMLLNGGNFIKNILSFFALLALIVLLMSGRWREYLLQISFILGYLVVLVFSAFAHSERFHQPAMPFEFMLAAYGLSIAVTKLKYKRWFMYWCGLMFIAAIAWNWFKLAGRGLL